MSSELTRCLSALVGPLRVSEVGYSREREEGAGGGAELKSDDEGLAPQSAYLTKNNKKLRLQHVRWVWAQREVFSSTHEGTGINFTHNRCRFFAMSES